MSEYYDPSSVEPKWQKKWEEAKVYETDLKKAKDPFYSLVMFPYPSGDKLHVGHWYNFAPADSYARYMRMQGKDVLEPMGFDAFGLPAENYAIKKGVHPSDSIAENTKTMTNQLQQIGCMYDWSKMVNSSTPEYYQWTQWVFLQMFKHDLAYKKQSPVNFCPSCQTVLANEQAQDGTCERCGTEVIQKPLNQWFWKTTNYAQRLLDGLEDLDWPEKTKLMQKNWIGRSEGAEIDFSIDGHSEQITVFTTRADTLFGATYMVLAPEHPLVEKITADDHQGAVEAYKEEVRSKTELQRTDLNKTKTGVPTGAFAINPVNNEKIPIWIADYVLMHYGTGAVMAVPAHDERDYEFAKTYDLPIREVIEGGDIEEFAHTALGVMMNSDFLDGLEGIEAKKKMVAWLENEEKGRLKITYRLKDWSIGRQRYWGAPIPIVYDPEGNPHAIPEEHLPWVLPTDVEFRPKGKAPLASSEELIERTEKIFGKGWVPEFDTMDTFVCSSFYYLRYLATGDRKNLIDPSIEKKWMPVDLYIGGPEHACMHLIYARFVMMALKDFGIVSHEEPFKKMLHQGLITNKGVKMSKSKGNVVSPDTFVEKYGADVFRMYLMFMGPFTDGGDWSDTGIKGIERFVQRIWKHLPQKLNKKLEQNNADLEGLKHKTIASVTKSLEHMQFNTAISALMEWLNALEKEEEISLDTVQTYIMLLTPLAPHLAEELWETVGGSGFVCNQQWPKFEPAKLTETTLTIAVQVSGKLRGTISVEAKMPKEDILKLAKENENVAKFLTSEIRKEIYVPGKLVNFVL